MLSTSMSENSGSAFMRLFLTQAGDRRSLFETLYSRCEETSKNSYPTLRNIFYAFFMELDKHKEFLIQDAMSGDEDARHKYGRLRIGPTFEDLCGIMAFFCREFRGGRYIQDDEVYAGVLKCLSGAVDDGIVVPTISRDGERGYRAGESRLPGREYYCALTEEEIAQRRSGRTLPTEPFSPDYCREVDRLQQGIENLYW